MASKILVQLVGDSRSLERSFKRANSSAQGFNKNMTGVGRTSKAGQKSMRGLGSSARLAGGAFLGGAGLVAGLTSTFKKAAEFEQSLNSMQAVSGATAEQMKRVGATALKLGADITLPKTSAKDAALAMVELAKGGLDVRQAMAAAKGTLQLAAAGQIEVADAATISARALNAFGLSGDQAGRVADVLANAANVSTGEISDFALALAQSSATAKQSGLTIEQTTAAIAELANKGIVGSDAGTSLKTMLTRLVAPTAKARKVMEELGVKTADASGNLIPFRDQIIQYQRALAKLTPAQRAAAINTIFGSDAQRAANVILAGGVTQFDKMHKAISRQGSAARISAALNKGLLGAFDGLKSAIETVQIQLGTQLSPLITKYLKIAATWLGNTKNQKKIMDTLKTAMASVAGVLRVIQTLFGALSFVVRGNRNAVFALIGVFALFKAAKLTATILGMIRSFGLLTTATNASTAATARSTVATKAAAASTAGLRLSLVGKVGLVGAAGAASFALTTLILKATGADKWLKNAGASAFDFAANLGLINDPLKKFEGKKLVTPALTQQIQKRAVTLHNKGLSDVQVQQRIGRENPNVAKSDIATLTGRLLARQPAVTINVYQRPNESGPALARRIKEEQLKAEKRNTIQRRGAVSGR